jgi:hypothetical protein
MTGVLYLLCLSAPLGDPSRRGCSAKHYLGFSTSEETLPARLEHHRAGRGSRMLAEASARGITWRVVWVRAGTRDDERRLKNAGHYAERLCDCTTEVAA